MGEALPALLVADFEVLGIDPGPFSQAESSPNAMPPIQTAPGLSGGCDQ
jgi:hypothetical protein